MPKSLFFFVKILSRSSSEYSNMSKITLSIPSTYILTPACIYKLFSSFKIITRTCNNFYFNSEIFEICLFFYIQSSSIFMAGLLWCLYYLGLSNASKISFKCPLFISISEKSKFYILLFSSFCDSSILPIQFFLCSYKKSFSQLSNKFSAWSL